MPSFIWVGPNEANIGHHSSKGYEIRREGTDVIRVWGPIQSTGHGGGRLTWLPGGRRERKPFPTKAEADEFIRKRIRDKQAEGYDRLPGDVRIHRK
jgi:predicted DNA-binding WGR domain protein